jgi:3-hydroxyacyl-CoA dehydrogenase
MFYADTVGLPTVLARVHEYRRQFGDHWRPSLLLETLAREGRSFYGDPA